MERPTGMRNRVVALSAVLVFAVAVVAVAVVAGSSGDDRARLEKLSYAMSGGAERSTMATGAGDAAYPGPALLDYRVRGALPDLADEAPAFRLADSTTPEAISKLASRLGLKGEVDGDEPGWTVRDGEWELSVSRVPGLPWYLGRRCAEEPTSTGSPESEAVPTSSCVASGVAYPVPAPPAGWCGKGSSGCEPATEAPTTSAPPCPTGSSCAYAGAQPFPGSEPYPVPAKPTRPADLPTREEAERVARSFLADLGVDLEGFGLQDEFADWRASVRPRFGGLGTVGWTYSATIGPKGRITGANGFLAQPELIGDYPLAGTAKGLERLRSGAAAGPRPLGGAMDGEATFDDPECSKPTVICDPPGPVTTVPASDPQSEPPSGPQARPEPAPRRAEPAPQVLTITGVHLALQQVGAALVPVYVFELEDGGETFPVPAVTDEWIEKNSQATRP